METGWRRRSPMKLSFLLISTLFLTACNPSPNDLGKVMEEHPEILFRVIEKHPEKFLAVMQNASNAAEEKLAAAEI
jgi:hypothetical protein